MTQVQIGMAQAPTPTVGIFNRSDSLHAARFMRASASADFADLFTPNFSILPIATTTIYAA